MYEAIRESIGGINAICVTPFDEGGDIDYPALGSVLDRLCEAGMKAIYPCGNTGEFYSLTAEEARETTAFAVRRIAGRAAVIAGVGHDVRTACALAVHAEKSGADGLMIHQPANPFQLPGGLVDYYRAIAGSVSLPVVLYIRGEAAAESLDEAVRIPGVVGVKYAINDLPAFARAVSRLRDEPPVWICGTAEMWAPFFFAAGATGFTSGMVNIDASQSLAMLDDLRSGDFRSAMARWDALRPLEELRERRRGGNNVSVVKDAMRRLGLLNGVVRPPIAPLTAEESAEVESVLRGWGLIGEPGASGSEEGR